MEGHLERPMGDVIGASVMVDFDVRRICASIRTGAQAPEHVFTSLWWSGGLADWRTVVDSCKQCHTVVSSPWTVRGQSVHLRVKPSQTPIVTCLRQMDLLRQSGPDPCLAENDQPS